MNEYVGANVIFFVSRVGTNCEFHYALLNECYGSGSHAFSPWGSLLGGGGGPLFTVLTPNTA